MMIKLASMLIAASAAVVMLLCLVHLLYTFYGPKLLPRDKELLSRMQEVSPVITRKTTMWNCWVGFNASHSFGGITFGVVYGYLALVHPAFLFQSSFLLLFGLALLSSYLLLAQKYWFSTPLQGLLLATVLYATALPIIWLR